MKKEIKKPTVVPLFFENYIAAARNSVGSKLFRNLYCLVNGHKSDVLRDGDLSCAFFVSSLLTLFGFTEKIHTTVMGTVKELEQQEWKRITKPRVGAIIVWSAQKFSDGEAHRHIGIFLGNGKAISNSYKKRSPQIHAWNYRPIEMMLWNPAITKKSEK